MIRAGGIEIVGDRLTLRDRGRIENEGLYGFQSIELQGQSEITRTLIVGVKTLTIGPHALMIDNKLFVDEDFVTPPDGPNFQGNVIERSAKTT